MAPLITLYILGGCVALAVVLFIVMIVVSAMRPPQLPDVSSFEPPLQRVIRALTPPFALPTSGPRFDAPQARTVAAVPSIAPPIARQAMSPVQMAPAPTPARRPTPPVIVAPVPTLGPAPRPPTPPRLQMPARQPAPQLRPSPQVQQRIAAPGMVPAPTFAPQRFAPPRQVKYVDLSKSSSRRGVYPVKHTRPLLRLVVGVFVTLALAAGAIVAYPPMLDAPCDDYEWFGSEAAVVVRDYARDANVEAAVFVEMLQDTPALTAP